MRDKNADLNVACSSGSIPRLSLVSFVVWGESPGCRFYSAQPLCLSGWETSSPTTHRGEVWKDGAKIPWGWSLPECFTSSGGFLTSPFIFNNSVETAAPFNVVSHPKCCEPRNKSLETFRTCNCWPQVPDAYPLGHWSSLVSLCDIGLVLYI